MFLAIVLFIALFLFSLWFTSFIAKALGAERPGMLWVFLVFIAMIVAQVLLGLTPLAQHPIIMLLLVILLATVIYAKILDMKLLGGFLTWLVTTVVMVLLGIGIGIIAGVSLPAYQDYVQRAGKIQALQEGEVTLETVAMAAETVCQCETDKHCLGDKNREFGQMVAVYAAKDASPASKARLQRYTERVLLCSFKPGPYDVAKAVIKQKTNYQATPIFDAPETSTDEKQVEEDVDNSDSETTDVTTTEKPNSPQSLAENDIIEDEIEAVSQPAYQKVTLADANKHIGRPARILRKSGKQMEGKLTSIGSGKVVIEQRRYGGVFSFPLKLTEIENFEVFY